MTDITLTRGMLGRLVAGEELRVGYASDQYGVNRSVTIRADASLVKRPPIKRGNGQRVTR